MKKDKGHTYNIFIKAGLLDTLNKYYNRIITTSLLIFNRTDVPYIYGFNFIPLSLPKLDLQYGF